MRKRDKEIAAYLADVYHRHGYPRRLIASTSKNSSRAVLDALMPLAGTPMFRGLTLSFQTHSEAALRDVKRQNIKHSAYFEMLDHARATDTRTYTEMILGLPGETLASFKEGLLVSIDRNPQSRVIVYRCSVLPNAELASAADRARFGLSTAWLLDRGSPELDPRLIEAHEVVVGTNAMPEADWGEAVEYAWLVILLHSLRLGDPALLLLRHVMGLDYVAIFDEMLSLLRQRPERLLGAQLQLTRRAVAQFLTLRDPSYRSGHICPDITRQAGRFRRSVCRGTDHAVICGRPETRSTDGPGSPGRSVSHSAACHASPGDRLRPGLGIQDQPSRGSGSGRRGPFVGHQG
jgi:hypothetical protein